MAKGPTSAGIALYRRRPERIEVLLVHPGGPFFARKDDGAWSIPKGLVDPGEAESAAARREFAEETGHPAPGGEPIELGEVRLKSGKRVVGFALEGDLDADTIVSNTFEMIWPPRSGRTRTFPEIDRGAWFDLDLARRKINAGQVAFLDRLAQVLEGGRPRRPAT